MIRIRTLIAVGLVAVLCALTGLIMLRLSEDIRSTESATNLAVVNGELSTEVESEVGQALKQILSFDPANPEATQDVAESVLTGKAAEQYETLLGDLEERAAGQELTLTANIAVIGVRRLSATTADLLVFLDQSSVREADDSSSVSAAQLQVSALKRDGKWLISTITVI